MRWTAAVGLALMLAQPAWSLSCMRPDIARDYAFAAQSEDRYIIVKGQLFFDETALPKRDMSNRRLPKSTDIPAWLDGYSLTRDGFTRRFQRDVILRVKCVASWCGSAQTGEYLAFLRQDNTEFVMEAGPCGGMSYPDPSRVLDRTVKSCMRGEPCEALQ